MKTLWSTGFVLFLLSACGGSPAGVGAPELPDDSQSAASGYSLAPIEDALVAGDLTEDDAAYFALSLFLGEEEGRIPAEYLEPAVASALAEERQMAQDLHAIILSALSHLEDLPADRRAEFEDLLNPVTIRTTGSAGQNLMKPASVPPGVMTLPDYAGFDTPVGPPYVCFWGQDGPVKVFVRRESPVLCPMDDAGNVDLMSGNGICDVNPEYIKTCSSLPDGDADPAGLAAAAVVLDIAKKSYDMYRVKLSYAESKEVVVTLGAFPNLLSLGLLAGAGGDGNVCQVMISTAAPSSWWFAPTLDGDIISNTAHELMHCAQSFIGLDYEPWVFESTAVWAQDYVGDVYFPALNTEQYHLESYFTTPNKPWVSRSYDATYPFLFVTDQFEPDFVFDFLLEIPNRPSPQDALTASVSGFREIWHEASISTWNESPYSPLYLNDGLTMGPRLADYAAPSEIGPDEPDVPLSFFLEPLSYTAQAVDVAPDVDMVTVTPPDWVLNPDLELSLVLQGGSHEEVMDITGAVSDILICRHAVGQCHDEPDSDLRNMDLLGIVATQTHANNSADFTLTTNSKAPQLNGTWTGSRGSITFNEEDNPDRFVETMDSYVDTCIHEGGSVSGQYTAVYTVVGEDTAFGTLDADPTTFTGGNSGYYCGDPSEPSLAGTDPAVNIFMSSPFSTTFEIAGNTLTVTRHSPVVFTLTFTR